MNIPFMRLIFMAHSLNAGVSILLPRYQGGMSNLLTTLLSFLRETACYQVRQLRLIFGQNLRHKILFSRFLLNARNTIQNWQTGFSSVIGKLNNLYVVDHHLSRLLKICPGKLPILDGMCRAVRVHGMLFHMYAETKHVKHVVLT